MALFYDFGRTPKAAIVANPNKTVVAVDHLPHLDLNATLRWQLAAVTWLLERQRFFVELKEGEATMISWKKLVANAERLRSASEAHKGLLAIDLPKSSSNMKLAVSSCMDITSETADSRPDGISPLDQDTEFSCCEQERNSNGGLIMDSSLEEAKIGLDEQVGPCPLVKSKMHRATPTACDAVHADTSRTKETKQTCVCCLEVDLTGHFVG